MSSVLIVQTLTAEWSKEHRGARGVPWRDTLPDSLPLPLERVTTSVVGMVRHSVYLRPDDNRPRSEGVDVGAAREEVTLPGTIIRPQDDGIVLDFQYTYDCGAPDRGWARKSLMASIDKWVRIKFNGRFALEGGWSYKLTCINAGLFSQLLADPFGEGVPEDSLTLLARLW